jgi:hypothetical protein
MHSLMVVSLVTHIVRRLKSLQSKHQNQNGATYLPATSVMWVAGREQARTFMYNLPFHYLSHSVFFYFSHSAAVKLHARDPAGQVLLFLNTTP